MNELEKKTKYDGNPNDGCTVTHALIVVIVMMFLYTILAIAEMMFK